MDDLVKRLLGVSLTAFPADIGGLAHEAADRIKQLEQELAEVRADGYTWRDLALKRGDRFAAEKALANQLASDLGIALSERDAEKALADGFASFMGKVLVGPAFASEAEELELAYRKARGL